jgi:hypothetical protein
VALVIDKSGAPHVFAKLALDDAGSRALDKEVGAMERMASCLPAPVFTPKILRSESGMVVFDAVRWRPRFHSWRLPEKVADALGQFFAATVTESGLGAGHGDFAPWNLLQADQGWVLVDWEDARMDLPPFFDVYHYLVQANVDLHRPTKRAILRGLDLEGWVGHAIKAYASGAGIPMQLAPAHFADYLRVSSEALDSSVPDHRPGLRARQRLAMMMSRLG